MRCFLFRVVESRCTRLLAAVLDARTQLQRDEELKSCGDGNPSLSWADLVEEEERAHCAPEIRLLTQRKKANNRHTKAGK